MGKSLVSFFWTHGVDVSVLLLFADVFLLQTDPMNLQLCLACNRHIRHSFCDDVSVLSPSSIRGLATPWTYFLHLSVSSVILTDSSTGSPAHVLMLSIQAVRGLPRLRAPGVVSCIISFSRQLPCFLMV